MIKKLFLFFSFLVLTGIYIYSLGDLATIKTDLGERAFSITTKAPKNFKVQNLDYWELVKGEKLQGTFIADDNYLGQVSVRFYNFQRINPDNVIFRIKEKGQSNWYYENIYKTDQFQPNQFFPFGFPVINDSKGRRYDFEVESLNGLPEHSIGLSPVKPLGAVLYKYPKSLLLSNPKTFVNFFINNKIKKIQINGQSFVALGIYLNFILISLFLIYFTLEYLEKKRARALLKINPTNVMVFALILLVLSAIILYLKKTDLSYLVTTLGYFILVIGVIYTIVESKRE